MATWPILNNTLDQKKSLTLMADGALPDPSWVPLMSVALGVAKLESKTKKAFQAALQKHAPAAATAFAKPMKPAKVLAAARGAGLDVAQVVEALLLFSPVLGLAAAVKVLPTEQVFRMVPHWHHLEWRMTGPTFPAGMQHLTSLEQLTLLDSQKLETSKHLDELAGLAKRLHLSLFFDGAPTGQGGFVPPRLEHFTPADVGTLWLPTGGSPVLLDVPDLAPLGRWKHLTSLSLCSTTLHAPSLEQLAAMRELVPQLKELNVNGAPAGWRQAWPGLNLLLGSTRTPAP